MPEPISPALMRILMTELSRDERVAWLGQPAATSRALAGLAPGLFGIPFLWFALTWIRATRDGFGAFAYVWGGMFVVILGSLGRALYRHAVLC